MAETSFFTRKRMIRRDIVLGLVLLTGLGMGYVNEGLSPQQNTRALLAQASISIDSSARLSCTDAIKRAVETQDINDGIAISEAKTKAEVLDTCFGAVRKDTAQLNPAAGKTKYIASDYECTGRAGTLTIAATNVTAETTAQKGVDMGKCELEICEGGKCGATQLPGTGASGSGGPQAGGTPQKTPEQLLAESEALRKTETSILQNMNNFCDPIGGSCETSNAQYQKLSADLTANRDAQAQLQQYIAGGTSNAQSDAGNVWSTVPTSGLSIPKDDLVRLSDPTVAAQTSQPTWLSGGLPSSYNSDATFPQAQAPGFEADGNIGPASSWAGFGNDALESGRPDATPSSVWNPLGEGPDGEGGSLLAGTYGGVGPAGDGDFQTRYSMSEFGSTIDEAVTTEQSAGWGSNEVPGTRTEDQAVVRRMSGNYAIYTQTDQGLIISDYSKEDAAALGTEGMLADARARANGPDAITSPTPALDPAVQKLTIDWTGGGQFDPSLWNPNPTPGGYAELAPSDAEFLPRTDRFEPEITPTVAAVRVSDSNDSALFTPPERSPQAPLVDFTRPETVPQAWRDPFDPATKNEPIPYTKFTTDLTSPTATFDERFDGAKSASWTDTSPYNPKDFNGDWTKPADPSTVPTQSDLVQAWRDSLGTGSTYDPESGLTYPLDGKPLGQGGIGSDAARDPNQPGNTPQNPAELTSADLGKNIRQLAPGYYKLGDGTLVYQDGKSITVTDLATEKSNTYNISENKNFNTAALIEHTQVGYGPNAQQADALRVEADRIAAADPRLAAALRAGADKIDPRIPANQPPPGGGQQPPGGGQQPPGGGQQPPPSERLTNSSGGGGGALDGIMKALGQALAQAMQPKPPTQPPVACPTDPNAFQQFQQQYQSQMQQYNYQLQLYQQQQQQRQLLGQLGVGDPYAPQPPSPQPPQQCTPSSQSQCQQQIPQPSPVSCTVGNWMPQYSGSCVVTWHCVPDPNKAPGPKPEAKISCEPSIADIGMTIAISYTCTNAKTSEGEGFSTDDKLSGSAEVVLAASSTDAKSREYGITCEGEDEKTKEKLTSSAQCRVEIAKQSMVLVANPQQVVAGETSSIGWITTGMKSCAVSSPDMPDFTAANASNTSVNGMTTTDKIYRKTEVILKCESASGVTKSVTTTINVK